MCKHEITNSHSHSFSVCAVPTFTIALILNLVSPQQTFDSRVEKLLNLWVIQLNAVSKTTQCSVKVVKPCCCAGPNKWAVTYWLFQWAIVAKELSLPLQSQTHCLNADLYRFCDCLLVGVSMSTSPQCTLSLLVFNEYLRWNPCLQKQRKPLIKSVGLREEQRNTELLG